MRQDTHEAKVEPLWRDLEERIADGRLGRDPLSQWVDRMVALGPDDFETLMLRLLSANPLLPPRVERMLIGAAVALGDAAVGPLKRQIGRLILEAQDRPERTKERELIGDIRARIEAAAARLLDRGDLERDAGARGTELVLARDLGPRQVMKIEEEARLSVSDWKVLEGHRNRVELIDTSLPALLRALLRTSHDAPRFIAWLSADVETAFRTDPDLRQARELWRERHGPDDPCRPLELDPAARRDMVIALGESSGSDVAGYLRKVIEDHELRREYPRIHREARRPLIFQALRLWHRRGAADGRRFSHSIARLIGPGDRVRWDRVEGLVSSQLEEVARAVQMFLHQGKRLRTRTLASRTLAVEVGAMLDSVQLLLLVSEEFLRRVHGCRKFAEALFGLDAPTLGAMRRTADNAVRRKAERAALQLVKRRKTMVDFVQSLRLVDEFTRERVLAMLDLATGQFPSLKIKNEGMDLLVVPYQEQEFERRFLRELRKRFRALVRVLHEDALRARLDDDDRRRLAPRRDDIVDLYDLLVAGRDYLVSMATRYDNVSEDFVFAEEEYKAEIEGRLIRLLTRPRYGFVSDPGDARDLHGDAAGD